MHILCIGLSGKLSLVEAVLATTAAAPTLRLVNALFLRRLALAARH